MTKEELGEIKSLIFDYIFPEPAFGVIRGIEEYLEARNALGIARECFDACQDFAKELIDEKLKEKEEKRK